ncbi:uncharacterized protein FIESC28_03690 [Fusarium coffeatum]|uniref:Uncharacterized protein n=1 Tax=Fusarium coffeatum TaxID=231269 RepID=A0A366S3R0_9HYPO|nr:uncharacterized protein FIESC28_03690 [Fusarium coffeatum]RBR23508.1 hypothetical protein FIESC28_03690 [Fusarium coffeatum]
MCQEIVGVCCYCGDHIKSYFLLCHSWHVIAAQLMAVGEPAPRAEHCEFRVAKAFQPWLRGCTNNDVCPSWFGNMFPGFSDSWSEETYQFEELTVAEDKYDEWKKDFARKYFVKRPIQILQEPEGFFESDTESVLSSSAATSSIDDGEIANETLQSEVDEDTHTQTDEANKRNFAAVDSASEISEIDPLDLFYGNVVDYVPNKDTRSNTVEAAKTSRAKSSREEYQDLAPVWTSFHPFMDMGRDREFND